MAKSTLKDNELFSVTRYGVTAYFNRMTLVCRYLSINTDVFKRIFNEPEYSEHRGIQIKIVDGSNVPYSEVNKFTIKVDGLKKNK